MRLQKFGTSEVNVPTSLLHCYRDLWRIKKFVL